MQLKPQKKIYYKELQNYVHFDFSEIIRIGLSSLMPVW